MVDCVAAAPHVWPVRVYYEDTDAGGVVYYANYLKFAERGRTEFLRHMGSDHASLMESHGILFAVKDCRVVYRRPARLDDALEVHTKLTGVGGATLNMEQVVKRDGQDLVELSLRLACIDRAGQPRRLPPEFRESAQGIAVGRA